MNFSNKTPKAVNALREYFAKTLVKRPEYSLRAFARHVSLSPTHLSEVLSGKRSFTRKIASRVFSRLNLTQQEIDSLLRSLPEKQTRSRDSQSSSFLKKQYVELSGHEFKVISDWYHLAILSLSSTKDFCAEPRWIAERLNIRIRDARSALQTLTHLGYLKVISGGKIKNTGKKFTTTNDVPDISIQKYHLQGLELARGAIEHVPVNLREITSSVVAINPKNLPKAKKRMREMKREIADILMSGPKTEVYQFQFHLFPLSHSKTP